MDAASYTDVNVELAFTERGCPLGFKCRASGIGNFDVRVYDDAKTKTHEIAHLIGGDERVAMPDILRNDDRLPTELLADLYHMARCRREMKRVGSDGPNCEGYAHGYQYHRERFMKGWKRHSRGEEANVVTH